MFIGLFRVFYIIFSVFGRSFRDIAPCTINDCVTIAKSGVATRSYSSHGLLIKYKSFYFR